MIVKRLLKYVVLTVFLTVSTISCTRLFFFPAKQMAGVPSDLGYWYDEITLAAADGTQLSAWLIKPTQELKGTVLFLHGNAENISTHIYSVLWMVEQGYQVLALDYRGYGQSSGVPDVPLVFDDIDAAVSWVKGVSPQPVYLFGQSLGASLAIKYLDLYPQSKDVFRALIVEAAFTRYGTIAKHVAAGSWITWLFQYPVQWLLTKEYDPLDAIASIAPLPVMVLHSTEDQVIPYSHGQQLYKNAKNPKQFVSASGPHISAVIDPVVREDILIFMQKYQN